MREKKKERLAEIKRKRHERERDSEDERVDEDRKRQKQLAEQQKKAQQALNFNLPIPDWSAFPKLVINRCLWTGPSGEAEVSDELKAQRKAIGVLVKGETAQCPPPVIDISNAHLPDSFRQYFTAKAIHEPTPVQQQCWPAMLAGVNLLGIAPTGSGKTLAYALPAMEHVLHQPHVKAGRQVNGGSKAQPSVLILAPTRELALQIHAVLKSLRVVPSAKQLLSGLLYGGQDKDAQLQSLRSAGQALQFLVATPGRLLDVLNQQHQQQSKARHGGKNDVDEVFVDLSKVSLQIIDEADRMLSLGFAEQLDAIARVLRAERQVVLFSATFPGRLRELSEQWAPHSVSVRCNTMEVKDFLLQKEQQKEQQQQQQQQQKESAANSNSNNKDLSSKTKGKKEEDVARSASSEQSAGEESRITDDSATAKVETSPAVATSSSAVLSKSAIAVSPSIAQHIHVCAAHKRPRLLMKFIERVRQQEKQEKMRQALPMIVFCNKIKTLKFVVNFLIRQSISCVSLHGQLPQQLREDNLNSFRSGKVNILISTDVAARGIHIKRLKYVVNYDFPANIEQYCHRIGRCGRQGESGEAYSLLTRPFAAMCADLIDLLHHCQQHPEPNLLRLAAQYAAGEIDVNEAEETGEGDGDEEEEVDEDNQQSPEADSA